MVLHISPPFFETKQVMLFPPHHSSSNLLRFLGQKLPFALFLFLHWLIHGRIYQNHARCVIIVEMREI